MDRSHKLMRRKDNKDQPSRSILQVQDRPEGRSIASVPEECNASFSIVESLEINVSAKGSS